ncbi:MAG TPA: hypothetical protein VGX03_02035 [Candidatus Binatia bacterium]|nr:hypothetical protein [Candidatus Binatia bacterium]
MRTQKTMTALTVIAVLLLAFSASAQLDKLKNTTPEERAEVQTAFMKSKLGLTADQTTKVADINLRYAQKMDPVIKGSSGLLTKRRQMNEVNREKEAELKQALSAEQFQKYLDSKEEMREKFEEQIGEKAKGGSQ